MDTHDIATERRLGMRMYSAGVSITLFGQRPAPLSGHSPTSHPQIIQKL